MKTEYSQAIEFWKQTKSYTSSLDELLKAEIKMPYADNILTLAFADGWNAKLKIKMKAEEQQLIAKQALRLEKQEREKQENSEIVKDIKRQFYAVGQPLNGNNLKFNEDQIRWALRIIYHLEKLNIYEK